MTRIAIVDDHDLLRIGLKTIIDHTPDLKFVGERSNGRDIVPFLKETAADIVLLDLRMPEVDGLQALEAIRAESAATGALKDLKVLVLTTSDIEENILSAVRLGVDGYALKALSPLEIVDAIKTVVAGGKFFNKKVRDVIEGHDATGELSAREKEVLQMMAKGLSNPEIGRVLDITAETAKAHIKHIFAKMNVCDRVEAVSLAYARGILKLLLPLACLMPTFLQAAPKYLFDDAYTADPSPLVYKDRLYVYAVHDADDAERLQSVDWRCYSTSDGTNWVTHGTVARPTDHPWGVADSAWAAECVERAGTFYLYTTTRKRDGAMAIGVLRADSPTGPFVDPIGRPLVDHCNGDIDPTVLRTPEGESYLYWGGGKLHYARLNADMISLDESLGDKGVVETGRPRHYRCGPHVWHHGDMYYMAYSMIRIPTGIAYATSVGPTGPWTFRGYLTEGSPRSPGNQVGVAEFLGRNWIFGYNYERYAEKTPAPRRHCERRSVCATTFDYDENEKLKPVSFWTAD